MGYPSSPFSTREDLSSSFVGLYMKKSTKTKIAIAVSISTRYFMENYERIEKIDE